MAEEPLAVNLYSTGPAENAVDFPDSFGSGPIAAVALRSQRVDEPKRPVNLKR